jgi:hypothetical protein
MILTEQQTAVVEALQAYADDVGANEKHRAKQVATEVVDMLSITLPNWVLYAMIPLITEYQKSFSNRKD